MFVKRPAARHHLAMGNQKTPLHIGQTDIEMALFEFQHAAICYIEAFYRHIEHQLIRITGDPNMSAQDCVILHAIRLGDRPKSIPDIQHFTNRSDIANIQYGVRKLAKAGLVMKARNQPGRGATYELTRKGRDVTDEYVRARREVIALLPHAPEALIAEVGNATRAMLQLTGVYDHVSRTDAVRER